MFVILVCLAIMVSSFKLLSLYYASVNPDAALASVLGADYYIFCGILMCLVVMWIYTTFNTVYVIMTSANEEE